MAKFEGVQSDILDSKLSTQLVSAGAGSGKTTVMIEKLTNLILKDNVDIDNVLVVTFTVLAAQEMKDRLIKSLVASLDGASDTDKILDIIERVKTASIDTFDGFNSKTIKKYFYALNISPSIEIISGTTEDYCLIKAMNKTLEQADENDLMILLDLFGGNARNYETIKDEIYKAYKKISNEIEPIASLDLSINEYKNFNKSENVINKYLVILVTNLLASIREVSEVDDKIQSKLDSVYSTLENVSIDLSLETNLEMLKSFNPISAGEKTIEKYPSLEAYRDSQEAIKEFKKKLKNNCVDTDFSEKNGEILKFFEIFVKILKDFIKNYTKVKEENNLVDFTDLNRLMIKLLKNDEILTELQNKYKYIFIDEYQDVNPLQDYLMTMLRANDTNLFMVGDLKQSIYGFRGSTPEMFLSKYVDLKSNKVAGQAFDMNLNFRSNTLIMDFVNDIFTKLMTIPTSDIDFLKDCKIDARRDDIPKGKVEIAIFTEPDQEGDIPKIYSVKNDQGEIDNTSEEEYIVNEIDRLVGTQFYDSSLKEYRPLEYKDIAILSQSEKSDRMLTINSLLTSRGIPISINAEFNLSTNESLGLIISILKCVLRIGDDVDYMASFLALTKLSIDDFVSLRDREHTLYDNLVKSEDSRVRAGFELLDKIRLSSYSKTNSAVIRYILDELGLRYYILKMPNGDKELKQLDMYLSSIGSFEDSINLGEFVSILDSGLDTKETINISKSQNSVTLETIHKSKGLEYPVVFLVDTGKEFTNDTDLINYNSNVGFGMDYYNTADRYKMGSIVKLANSLLNQEKLKKEKLRLLYVAMTRAKNKLYITGTIGRATSDYATFLNLIMSCYPNIYDGDFENNNAVIKWNPKNNASVVTHTDKSITRVKEEFKYSNTDKFKIVFKNTVTGINSERVEQDGYHVTDITKQIPQYSSDDIRLIGTHYHKALELCDFNCDYVKNTDYQDVDYSLIKKAHEILRPLVNGDEVKKEAEFMMYIPYNEIADSTITDKVLIQGVIDLMIVRKDSIDIVDYKFSSLTTKALKEKYKEQLELYKMAVERAYKKPVKNIYIYSIKRGELG